MKNELRYWSLTEGRIGMEQTLSPKVSEVIAALEAIRHDQQDPFVTLSTPWNERACESYCQAWADDAGYVCEVRIYSGEEFRHSRSFLRDAQGCLNDKNDPQLPSLSQAVRIFTGFTANPNVLPVVADVEWLDVSDEFEPAPA
jgi:hypothetical protein